jgi:hypothetical protein
MPAQALFGISVAAVAWPFAARALASAALCRYSSDRDDM